MSAIRKCAYVLKSGFLLFLVAGCAYAIRFIAVYCCFRVARWAALIQREVQLRFIKDIPIEIASYQGKLSHQGFELGNLLDEFAMLTQRLDAICLELSEIKKDRIQSTD